MIATALLEPAVETQSIQPSEQRFVLDCVEWEQYEQIAEALNGRHVRLTYDRGALEFMTIGSKHGWLARLIARFIVVLSEETGTPRRSCGDITMKRMVLERGIEPDDCFYLTNEQAIRGRDEIDFEIDPPPDLGVEVDIAASSRRRMPVYAALGVPEVWRYARDRVTFHRLSAAGAYEISETSRYFPFLTSTVLNEFLGRRSTVEENALVQSFREWVRQQIAAQ